MPERATYEETSVNSEPEERVAEDRDVNDEYHSYTNGANEDGQDDADWFKKDTEESGLNEDGLDDDLQEETQWDPNQEGIGEPDWEKGSTHPDHERALQDFLTDANGEDKSISYDVYRDDDTKRIEQITMSYRGTEDQPGLADITAEMRDKMGYADNTYDSKEKDAHADAILEKVLGYRDDYLNDSINSRHDRAIMDLSRSDQYSMRTPTEIQDDVTYARQFSKDSKELYESLRENVKDELLNGQPSAEKSFTEYQDKINNAAIKAATSYEKADKGMGDYYQILDITPDATSSAIRTARGEAAFKYHDDRHPYPEYDTYMKQANAAYETLSDPSKRETYDALLQNSAEAHERWQQTHPNYDEHEDYDYGNGNGNEQSYEVNHKDETGFGDTAQPPGADVMGSDVMGYNQNDASDTSLATYEPPQPQETGTQDPSEDPTEDTTTDWTPEKVANWQEEHEARSISWIELILLAIASMIANATEGASGGQIKADGLNRQISAYINAERGPSVQEQHTEGIAELGNATEDVTTKYAVKDEGTAEVLKDLTLHASEHLEEYGMFDEKGEQKRNGDEPYFERIVYDEDDKPDVQKVNYEPIKGLEWDNPDRTLDDTMHESMTGTNDDAMANRKSLSDMMKERVDWIQQTNSYVNFSEPDNYERAQELLDQYNENQVNLDERKAAIDPVLLWNAENNFGGMTTYLDKSIAENRELTHEEVQAIADTIRHCDYMVNATGTKPQPRRQR